MRRKRCSVKTPFTNLLRGHSPYRLAKAVDCHFTSVYRWLWGRRFGAWETLPRIAHYLGRDEVAVTEAAIAHNDALTR